MQEVILPYALKLCLDARGVKPCAQCAENKLGVVQMALGEKASQWASQVPAGTVLTVYLWPELIIV